MSKKKKAMHWSKLPRAKLIVRLRALDLQVAKLKTQLAEARETRLLNERNRPFTPAESAARTADPTFAFPWETN